MCIIILTQETYTIIICVNLLNYCLEYVYMNMILKWHGNKIIDLFLICKGFQY